jgi:hypothetical protein
MRRFVSTITRLSSARPEIVLAGQTSLQAGVRQCMHEEWDCHRERGPVGNFSSKSRHHASLRPSLARSASETPPTWNSSSPVCRMNWVSHNSLRNRAQEISAMNYWMYCEQISAWLTPRSRTVRSAAAPAFPELEVHLLGHTSHNGTRKSAYLLPLISYQESTTIIPFTKLSLLILF